MRITTQNQAAQAIYQLRDEETDEVFGEAVISELENEIRLHGIFVKPEHRGKGHGTSLMEAVITLGDTRSITLCTGLGNIGFFRRFGFEVISIGESLVSMEKKP